MGWHDYTYIIVIYARHSPQHESANSMINFRDLAQALMPQLVAWRRDFHQHPELGFEEVRTADIVAAHLRNLNIETSVGVGKTGVVGLVRGSGPGPTVLLRFDMDALPIQEQSAAPYASQRPGRMHACGHDAHTAMGMGVAQLLAHTREQWPGQVKLLFQPAEEGLGGALATIRDGVLTNPRPDAAFALHVWNQAALGTLTVQAGPFMAAADRFEIEIIGHGGHGAAPEDTIDALLIGAQVVNALHHIISRNIPPHETAVLSLGSFHAGNAFNVIAQRATLSGTLRTFEPAIRNTLIDRMGQVLEGICTAYGASYTFNLIEAEYTPAVRNDPRMAEIARQAASNLFEPQQIIQIRPMMVSEDMSEILNRVPGCYIMLGAEPETGALGSHHNPKFDINEEVLPLGTALMAQIATHFLLDGTSAASPTLMI
jgi:amidohydrolase